MARSCPYCGMTYTPDARDAEEKIQDDMKQDYRETDPSDTDKMDKLDQLDTLLDDPEIKQLLHERLDE